MNSIYRVWFGASDSVYERLRVYVWLTTMTL